MRSEIEWLGFELAVRRLLMITPAAATLLAAMARRPGRLHKAEHLEALAELSEGSLVPTLSRLREALFDLGFSAKITFDRVDKGYRLSPGAVDELWARVLDDLALAA